MIWLIQTLLDTNIQLNPNTRHAQGLPVHYGFPTITRGQLLLWVARTMLQVKVLGNGCWSHLPARPTRQDNLTSYTSILIMCILTCAVEYLIILPQWSGGYFTVLHKCHLKHRVHLLLFFHRVIKSNVRNSSVVYNNIVFIPFKLLEILVYDVLIADLIGVIL